MTLKILLTAQSYSYPRSSRSKSKFDLMGKKGSKKTEKKTYKQGAAYLRKGPKKSKGGKRSKKR